MYSEGVHIVNVEYAKLITKGWRDTDRDTVVPWLPKGLFKDIW